MNLLIQLDGSKLLDEPFEESLTLSKEAEVLAVTNHQNHPCFLIRESDEVGQPYPRRFKAVKASRMGDAWRGETPDGFKLIGVIADFGTYPYFIFEERMADAETEENWDSRNAPKDVHIGANEKGKGQAKKDR